MDLSPQFIMTAILCVASRESKLADSTGKPSKSQRNVRKTKDHPFFRMVIQESGSYSHQLLPLEDSQKVFQCENFVSVPVNHSMTIRTENCHI